MKKFISLAALLLLFAGCNRYDDSALKAELSALQERVAKLETLCGQMNTNISSLQDIVGALRDKVYVTGVAPVVQEGATIGYTISFTDGKSITLYNGKDGTDGGTPVIGVAQKDGKYWWTIDGEWLLDAAGGMIQASGTDGADGKDGITPQLKIEDGWWFVSIDGGTQWTKLGKATGEDGDSFFSSVSQDESKVYIVLSDGTSIVLPKTRTLELLFEKTRILTPGRDGSLPFRITGASDDLQVIAFCSDSMKVAITVDGVGDATPADTLSGTLDVHFLGDTLGGSIMVAATSKDMSSVKILDMAQGRLETDKDFFEIERGGGSIAFTVFRNMEAEIVSEADWMSVDAETRTIVEQRSITVAENTSGEDRTGRIVIRSKENSQEAVLTVKQFGKEVLEVGSVSNRLDFMAGSTATLEFTCSGRWTAELVDTTNFAISPTEGGSGTHTLTIMARTSNTETGSTRRGVFTINSGSLSKRVVFWQYPAFVAAGKTFTAGVMGGEVQISCTFNRNSDANVTCEEAEGFDVLYDATKPSYFTTGTTNTGGTPVISSTVSGDQCKITATYTLPANYSGKERSGKLRYSFSENGHTVHSEWITLTQQSGNFSSDYSQDGKVTTLQTHSLGNGIKFVLMGDGFKDTDIASGKYDEAMQKALQYCFDIPPYDKLKEYFDVYQVTAVSPSMTYDGTTRFAVAFGDGTNISGDDELVKRYASRATPSYAANNTVVFIVVNSDRYAGTAYLYTTGRMSDIPEGLSLAYIPMTDASNNSMAAGFREVLHHEALGHGFGKLADEYYSNRTIDDSGKSTLNRWQGYGFYRNVSLKSDPAQTTWAAFAADSRYASEKIGCYEGGYTYSNGVYRPSQISIMYHNSGGFNAPSREAIYKRAMYLAYGSSWKYDYETFVEFDGKNETSGAAPAPMWQQTVPEAGFIPLGEPRIIVVDDAGK